MLVKFAGSSQWINTYVCVCIVFVRDPFVYLVPRTNPSSGIILREEMRLKRINVWEMEKKIDNNEKERGCRNKT